MTKDRKEYWDKKYYDYWKNRVDEANNTKIKKSHIISGDYKVVGDEFYEKIFSFEKFGDGKLIDVGCGWGRFFPLYFKRNLSVFGVDISKFMVEEVLKKFKNTTVKIGEAENLPFLSNSFDFVTCLGVFDATHQNFSLSEMLRVAKVGGKLLFTGKNNLYFDDDDEALLAEIGAIKKGEPNYFTDFKKMQKEILENGHIIRSIYFFPRRGDFAEGKYLTEIKNNERFYEFLIVIEKNSNNITFKKFHSEHSNIYKKIYSNG